MSDRTFLLIFLAIPALFVTLDGIELHRQARVLAPSKRASREAIAFMLLVVAIYAALQFGGLSLVPSTERLMEAVRGWSSAWLGRPPSDQPIQGGWLALLTVTLFYVSGLWDYLLHRFFSHSRSFFFTHEYHHLPNQVHVAMPGLAVRPFVVVTSFPGTVATVFSAYGILLILGLPLWDLAPLKALLLAQLLVLTASHSCFMRRGWWAHRMMKWLALTTPQEHVLHHTVDLQGNYGNFTILWDRVFGTYLDPTRENQGHAFGLPYDQDFLGTLTLGRLKLPAVLRRRFQVGRFCNLEPAAGAEGAQSGASFLGPDVGHRSDRSSPAV